MYIQKRFSLKAMLQWTKRELIFFIILSIVFTFLYEVFDFKWLQLPFAPIGIVGTAVAFIIGFQNNAAYDRIWEARKIWGGIVNVSRSFIITTRDSFYLHQSAEKVDEIETMKVITNRHIAWLTALRYAMRARKGWETYYDHKHRTKSFQYLVPEYETTLEEELKPLLSEEEFKKVMSKDNKPNAIISIQSKHLRKLVDQNKIWDYSLLELQKMMTEMTALQGKSERIKNFPYPKQYASIGYHFVHIFMWLLPLAIIPTFDALGNDLLSTNPIVGSIFVWLNIPFTVAVIWVFNTMLRIGLAGENPFEGSPNDVPISNISRGITRDLLQIIDVDVENIPEQFESLNQVQM